MNPRERILAALSFQPVDTVPLQIHPSPAGLHEHGQKLLDLMRVCGHDFDDQSGLALPQVPAADFDPDGRFHKILTDAWGTTWEYRLFGVWGYRIGYPLADLSRLAEYYMPDPPRLEGTALAQARRAGETHRRSFFHLGGGVSLFETMQSLCPFEEVLVGIARDAPEIHRLADRLVEYYRVIVENALAIGVDAISVGDDFGTQQALMISPHAWRRFFFPRYQALFEPVRRAGKRIFFHSCGKIDAILEDLREVGADAIWPQLPLYDPRSLAQRCRALGLAVQLHPDRGELLQRATPGEVRSAILRLVEAFETLSGGSWLYLEVDPGFPWENVKAMFETAMALRSSIQSQRGTRMTVYDFTIKDAHGKEKSLADYAGKVLLIVNTASQCGNTPQYAGLQALYAAYRGRGLEILGFPCDQFGHQEPGTNEEIQQFCEVNYGVTFPVFAKIEVNGENADPLYRYLRDQKQSAKGSSIQWNFEKFLVDRQGNVVARRDPKVNPDALVEEIEQLLAA